MKEEVKGRYIQISNVDLWRGMNWLKRALLWTLSNQIGSSKSCVTLMTRWGTVNFSKGFCSQWFRWMYHVPSYILIRINAKLCRTEKSLKPYELQVSLYCVSGHDTSHGLSRTMQIFYATAVPHSETR